MFLGGMIVLLIIADNEVKPILDYLNSLKLTDIPCYVIYLPCYSTVGSGNKEGFAAYM